MPGCHARLSVKCRVFGLVARCRAACVRVRVRVKVRVKVRVRVRVGRPL